MKTSAKAGLPADAARRLRRRDRMEFEVAPHPIVIAGKTLADATSHDR